MVNWKKWFLTDEEVEKETNGKEKDSKEENFEIEFYEDEFEKTTVKSETKSNYEEFNNDYEEDEIGSEFDLTFEEDEEQFEENNNQGSIFSKIKNLFASKNKQVSYKEDEFEEDEEVEDYKTYLNRQKQEEKEHRYAEDFKNDNFEKEHRKGGLLTKIKSKLFEVSEEEVKKENIESDISEFDEDIEKKFEDKKTEQNFEKEKAVVSTEDSFELDFEIEYTKQDESTYELDEYLVSEKKENVEEISVDKALKKLGLEEAEVKDVDIFGDRTERRSHPTLAAVRIKRLKHDYEIENLSGKLALEEDSEILKYDLYKEGHVEEKPSEENHVSKHEEQRIQLNEDFNTLVRKDDKISKDTILNAKVDENLDNIFSEIKEKEQDVYRKEQGAVIDIKESLINQGERREKLKYTTVDDVLKGSETLLEDDIDKTSKKTIGDRFEEQTSAPQEVEEFRKDVYSLDKNEELKTEKTELDNLMESTNVKITKDVKETLPEIESLNENLKNFREKKEDISIETQENNIDLVEQTAKNSEIYYPPYDEIEKEERDILAGYSDYHLDNSEIEELTKQDKIENSVKDIDIDSLTKAISPELKKNTTNDVDEFIETKTIPAREFTVEDIVEHKDVKEKESIGIEYVEKLYSDEAIEFFEEDRNTILGDYKTVDRGYRPVSKEKIENNQKVLEAIFEKYSNTGYTAKSSVTSNMMSTSQITPRTTTVGKFKPSPVYSSIYGSVGKSTKQEKRKLSDGISINETKEKASPAKLYKEIAEKDEMVWNIGSSKRVPKNKVAKKKK